MVAANQSSYRVGHCPLKPIQSNSAWTLSRNISFCSSSRTASSSSSSTSVCSAAWASSLAPTAAEAPCCCLAFAWAACQYVRWQIMDVHLRNFMPTLAYSDTPITICILSPQPISTLHEIRTHDEQTLLVACKKGLALRLG